MIDNIIKEHISFTQCSYSLTALPIIPYLKLTGFAPDGVVSEDVELATKIIGADGLVATNIKPVTYPLTFNFYPHSPCRNILDNLVMASIPAFGKRAVSYEIILTEINNTTGYGYIYSGGIITSMKSINDNNLDEGQGIKTYKMEFNLRVQIPK